MPQRTLLLPLVFVLAACARAPVPPPPPPAAPAPPPSPAARAGITPAQAEALLEATTRQVEEIRGLPFRSPVRLQVVDDAASRRYAVERLERFLPAAQREVDERAYRALGLLPPGTGLLDALLGVVEEQAGGFYDPASKTFYLLDDMPAGMAPSLMAHELTHALEDQHFDLDGRLQDSMEDDDRLFALGAVHEGTASIVMSIAMARGLQAGTLTAADLEALQQSEAGKGVKLQALPPALRRSLLGSYGLGLQFLLHPAGGLAGLASGFPADAAARAYRDGPVSSEQLLHPEKFWDRRDDPRPVDLSAAGRGLGTGWSRAGSGELGELLLGVMVGAPTPGMAASATASPAEWTNAAAAGWGGDRWELWRGPGGEEVVVLGTAWDTPEDAAEFARALPPRDDATWRVGGDRVAAAFGGSAEARERALDALVTPARP